MPNVMPSSARVRPVDTGYPFCYMPFSMPTSKSDAPHVNVTQNACHESSHILFLLFCAICDLQSLSVLEGIHSALNKTRTIQMVKAGKQEEDLMSIKIYQATYSAIKGKLSRRGERPGPDEDVQVGMHIPNFECVSAKHFRGDFFITAIVMFVAK
jgi:hypothetical protein